MLEVHRWRQIEWRPSAVVALATSVNGMVVAAARENGAVELWNVAPGSVGWHCHLTIPGKEDAAISSLVWCKSSNGEVSSLGRLFSAGLDGYITEWDLQTLQPKEVVESYGGSVWHMAVEPLVQAANPAKRGNGNSWMQNRAANNSNENSDSSGSDSEGSYSEDEGDAVQEAAEQRVAVGCDDGCVRVFTVGDSQEGMVYRRSFPRIAGRILSVAWSIDGSRIFSGGSDGCIHCWDSSKVQELYRITAGIGGAGEGPELCVWSLIALRDGTIVSGDSTGSTQFWEGKHGTLLQAHAKHNADVLALVASPSHRGVYAAGADGQVVLYQHVDESRAVEGGSVGNVAVGALADKWVFVGSKRAHTHDVQALAVAFPRVHEEDHLTEKKGGKRVRKKDYYDKNEDHKKWVQPGTAMLISGGSDSKLFTYPANAFLAFHQHDICPAPERPHIQLANEAGTRAETVFMVQHSTWIDVWRTHTSSSTVSDLKEGLDFSKDVLGKRKVTGEGDHPSRKSKKANGVLPSNGSLTPQKASRLPASNGKKETLGTSHSPPELARTKGISPRLLAKIKCKSAEHICCSAISGNGQYVAFSDRLKPRLYKLELHEPRTPSSKKMRVIAKKKLPAGIPAAQSMHFTNDFTQLLLGSPHQIMVIDVESSRILHSFHLDALTTSGKAASILSPLKFMCTSADSQWLAVITSCGRVHIFNLETLRHHWSVPVLDGSVATSAIFMLRSSNVLIISTSSNQIHVLNVEGKELSEWSAVNGVQLSHHMLEFPGAIIGLSVAPNSKSTCIIVYSSRAMCQIDLSRPLRKIAGDVRGDESLQKSAEESHSNGVERRVNYHSNVNNNFVVVHFKDPVLFLGHTSPDSLLVVEKPWLVVLREFPAPVFRHLYGT